MIEDVDIGSCFQDLEDEPPFGQEDHREDDNEMIRATLPKG